MSRVCHECGKNIDNTFYDVSATFKTSDKLAFTDMSCSLCEAHYQKIKNFLLPIAPEGLSYAIDSVTGSYGGLHIYCQTQVQGTVQLLGAYETHGQYEYLSQQNAQLLLPKIVVFLQKKPNWVEKIEGSWKKADWRKT